MPDLEIPLRNSRKTLEPFENNEEQSVSHTIYLHEMVDFEYFDGFHVGKYIYIYVSM